MKLVNDILEKIKGTENINKTVTGKGRFNFNEFKSVASALANDTTYHIKDVKSSTDLNLSTLIREDIKKTIEKAKFPQKSEIDILNKSDVCVDGIAKSIPYIVMEYLKTGKRFELPEQENMKGSIYLKDIPGKVREVQTRSITSKTPIGSTVITTKDHIQLRAKSSIPSHLKTKVRKDLNGKVIND